MIFFLEKDFFSKCIQNYDGSFLVFQTEIDDICWQQQGLTAQKRQNICKDIERIAVFKKCEEFVGSLATEDVRLLSTVVPERGILYLLPSLFGIQLVLSIPSNIPGKPCL